MRGMARLWRELRLDRNPLRRACDRAEAYLLAGLLAAFFVAVPLAAVIVGGRAYGAGLRAEAAWHPVSAVLLGAAPEPGSPGYELPIPASWTAPDRTRRVAWIIPPPGTPAGRTVTMWVDAAGHSAGAPVRAGQVIDQAIIAAVIAAAAAGFALLFAAVLARWVLFRRRLAAWDAEWRAVGPRWRSIR